ncbi:hypothetical protein PJI17_32160, partial [Mycobacterium kansasii]
TLVAVYDGGDSDPCHLWTTVRNDCHFLNGEEYLQFISSEALKYPKETQVAVHDGGDSYPLICECRLQLETNAIFFFFFLNVWFSKD